MAGKKQATVSKTTTFTFDEGFSVVANKELEKAYNYLEYKHCHFVRYELTDKEAFTEVLAVIQVDEAADKRAAEWAAQLAVKNYHPSVWKAVVMAMENDSGFIVYVRWAIWKNRASQAEQPSTDISF